MTERQMQFRVGLFTIFSLGLIALMVFKFGQLDRYWQNYYEVTLEFTDATGVYPGTPLKRNGIQIGQVKELTLQPEKHNVAVDVRISEQYPLPDNVQPRLIRSLLGGVTIEFAEGDSPDSLADGAVLVGIPAQDPMQIVNRLEKNVNHTLQSFGKTSQEWGKVGQNVNHLLVDNRKNLDHVIVQAAQSLQDFSETMKQMNRSLVAVNQTVADPENQRNLKRTLASLPKMIEDTEETIGGIRQAVGAAQGTLANLDRMTTPLAQKSNRIAGNLDGAVANLNSLTSELNTFSQILNKSDGTFQQLASNPELYRNLNRTAQSVNLLMNNLQPALRDLRVFSDKVAAHPELLGVSGVFKGSSGVKEAGAPNGKGVKKVSGAINYGQKSRQ